MLQQTFTYARESSYENTWEALDKSAKLLSQLFSVKTLQQAYLEADKIDTWWQKSSA